jgi:prepilin-type N-terminal cleavage/methylation domain-containing protein
MKKIHFRIKSQGFTLVELLLVIAVIAVLLTFGLSTYRERALNLKAEKVAQQMQLILQAGANYYVRNNCWPNNLPPNPSPNHRCINNPSSEPFMPDYFPIGPMRHPSNPYNYRLYNPFASNPNSNADDATKAYQYSRAGIAPNEEGIFQVESGVLPTNEFAQRVAALLPNAWVMTNSTKVAAQISPPGTQIQGNVVLMGGGKVSNGGSVTFSCEQQYDPYMFATMQHVEVNTSVLGLLTYSAVINRCFIQPHCTITALPQGRTGATCQPTIEIYGQDYAGSASGPSKDIRRSTWINYLLFCCKHGTTACSSLDR